MATLFDRLNHELEALGKRAQSALDEGKSQIELMRVKRYRDQAARDLGLLVHRRERGHETDAARIEALLRKLDDLEAELASLEREIAAARGEASTVGEAPAPAGAAPADAADPEPPAAV